MEDNEREQTRNADRRRAWPILTVAGVLCLLLAVSFVGSSYWRPPPSSGTLLPLGRTTAVRLSAGSAEETFARVLEAVAPSVAFIRTLEGGNRTRSGSGVVVHEAGFVVTNAHVVDGIQGVRVAIGDGLEADASVYGIDKATDLAVVKVPTAEPVAVAALGDSDELRVGEFVLAVGAPFSFRNSATSGIISGLHRGGLGIAPYEDFIVTDAPINRGNSGGPLVNLRGEVVGINTAIIARDGPGGRGGFSGIGFAIPINIVKVVARRLIGDGGLERTAAREARRADRQFARETGAASTAVAHVRALGRYGETLRNGSGFVIESTQGQLLITNAHVVENAARIEVQFPGREPLRGEEFRTRARLDLAFVRLDTGDRLPALVVGDSASLRVDDAVVALGALSSHRVSRSEGVVTNLDYDGAGLATGTALIETSARTVHGFSGGPLIDENEVVVAILTGRMDAARANDGASRSYAVPIAAAREAFPDLLPAPGSRQVRAPTAGGDRAQGCDTVRRPR